MTVGLNPYIKSRGVLFALLAALFFSAFPAWAEDTAAAPNSLARESSSLPALDPIPEKTLSVEERVDSIFGVIVEHMVTVLFWDVVFWDNSDSMVPAEPLGKQVIHTILDPLSWGIVTLRGKGGAFYDRDGDELSTYSFEGEPTGGVFSQDGMTLYVGNDRGVLLSMPRTGGESKELLRLNGALTQVKLSPGGKWIFVGSLGGDVSALHLDSGEVTPLAKHRGGISSIAFREDGRFAAIASRDGRARVFDLTAADTPREVATLTHSGELVFVGFAGSESQSILTLSADGSLVLQGEGGQGSWKLEAGVTQGWLSSDAKALVANGSKGLTAIQLVEGAKGVSLKGDGMPVQDILFSGASSFYALKSNGALSLVELDGEGLSEAVSLSAGGTTGGGGTLQMNGKGVLYLQSGGTTTPWGYQTIFLPFVVFWLTLGAIFFTLRMGFVNFRMFAHAIQVVKGVYDNPDDEGEVTHFQALTSALSATVGLGNIAGVAIAVSIGGPGATFWMIMTGLLGMASKFAECTLGQKYRTVNANGEVMGGAMHYLSKGLAELNMTGLGKVLSVMFAVLCVGASFGGGNSFQVKQSLGVLSETIPFFADYNWVYGLVMMVAVGAVILGGIKRIAQTAEKVVPAMCGIYVAACLYVILVNVDGVGAAFGEIFSGAFDPDALYGGLVGVLVVGVTRAAFSNEAGIGSAAIAHAAAKTEYPVREGVVALLEPFIDTVVICTMTALVIVITGAYENPEYGMVIAAKEGAQLTALAMGEEISWFPYVLSVAVVLFAYSTMISWSYYGERCWTWLFGPKSTVYYRLLFLVFVFLGSIMTASNILDFSDLMILGMAIPNILGVMLLSGKVRKDLDDYVGMLSRGEMKRWK